MSRKSKISVAVILVLVFSVALFSACGGKQDKPENPTPMTSAEPKQNSYVLKDLPEGVSFDEFYDPVNKYVESVDLYDEDSVGSEYWKVRVCSEEEQAKGNMFETDYFFFGEPRNHIGFYKLTIKENVTLPKNLYLGWLVVVGGNSGIFRGHAGYYVPEGLFEGRQEIETVSLPERYPYSMSGRMFANCFNLKTVYVRVWENWWDQLSLKWEPLNSSYFPYIAPEMFINCMSLEKVILSSVAVQNEGYIIFREGSFMNCISLKGVYPDGAVEYHRQTGKIFNYGVGYCTDALANCIKFGPVLEGQKIHRIEESLEQRIIEEDERYRKYDEDFWAGH